MFYAEAKPATKQTFYTNKPFLYIANPSRYSRLFVGLEGYNFGDVFGGCLTFCQKLVPLAEHSCAPGRCSVSEASKKRLELYLC